MNQNWIQNSFFSLFENCKIVNGVSRSLICDLQRENYCFIPNALFEILSLYNGKSREEIINIYGKENEDILIEYFEFLEEREFIFWVENKKDLGLFNKLNLNWEFPATITNCIFQISSETKRFLKAILRELELMNCQDIQFQINDNNQLTVLKDILELTKNSRLRSLEIYMKWENNFDKLQIENLIQNYPRVRTLIVYSSPFFYTNSLSASMGILCFLTDSIDYVKSCGIVHYNYFNTNIKLFTEAQKHNTCLNRKISIDVNGEIKNCPSMAKSYGNIIDTTLQEAIDKPGFKDMWYINKNQINVCKDCEFRYICTDCRAYTENPEDIYSKPLKCGYNPYTAEWEEWSTNPLKQKAIEYYGMQELVKK